MSSNFFAALEDSGDEAPVQVKENKKKSAVGPSKVDERKRPNHNDRNTKFGRGGRVPPREGKRAYDRRSGTGRGKEIKKGGGGAHNWGSDKIEARQAEGVVVEEEDEEELLEVSEIAETEDEPKPEPEDNTMSYEEYLASKQQPDNEAFAPVKEREVTNEFANLKPKVSDEEDFLVMGGGKQKKARAKKDEKQTVETSFRVTPNAGDRDSGRGRGRGRGVRGSGRGGRPGGRGGGRSGPRGSSRGERGSGRGRGRENLNVGDTRAFPSL